MLAEVAQASEWSPEREDDIPGLARYAERDPGMSAQQLEDRAPVASWRKCAADHAGDVGPLKRLAGDTLPSIARKPLRWPSGLQELPEAGQLQLAEREPLPGSLADQGRRPSEAHHRAGRGGAAATLGEGDA